MGNMPVVCGKCHERRAEVHISYARLSLCPECFLQFFVRRLRRVVEDFRMFGEDEVVGVAVSGGKDSAALLHGLRQAFPSLRLFAFHVNLGIDGYSEHCQAKAEALAKILGVDFHVFDFQKEVGISVGDFRRTVFRGKVCSACGTLKRHAFDELAQRVGVKVLATGHNMDDVAGFMLNNFFSGQWSQLVRLKPVLQPSMPNLTVKVKPLIKSPENENLLYCLYADIPFREVECPFARGTRTRENALLLNSLSRSNPYFRHQVLRSFLKLLPLLEKAVEKPALVPCRNCGFPSLTGVCAYCKRVALARNVSRGKT
jgi:uncharacterized protein (TIGR00269 family)